MLAATSEQRTPVNNGKTKSGQANFDINFDWKTSKEQPPMLNGHFSWVPGVAVVDRFDYIKITSFCYNLVNVISLSQSQSVRSKQAF